MFPKKVVLTSVIASALALSFGARAEDAPKPAVPTLDQVLDATGLTVSGYLDAGYEYANKAPADRVFDTNQNSFDLHQAGLTVAKQPKEGFGGLVNVIAGSDAQLIHSAPVEDSKFDLTQAYLQYATGPLTVIGGKFVTLAGTEVIASPSDMNVTRSVLFGAVPFTHTGVRATYAASDMVSLTAGVNNGWDQMQDANKQKLLELAVGVTPTKTLSFTAVDYYGTEPNLGGGNSAKELFNLLAAWTATDALTVNGEYLYVTQDEAFGPGTNSAKYQGLAGYVTYVINDKWRTTVRAEYFKDSDGLRFGVLDNKITEATLTLAYLPTKSVELRGEVRTDHASQDFFADNGGVLGKSMYSLGAQAIYKF
ncbi:MAG TPA: outer membrane beta-barrel protein [Burkholderiales bacterium]|nr:outer membrane beta-barrel protein [Burkholderiales bacterium]